MRIWLPDDKTQIQVDVNNQDNTCEVYQERFTFTLQAIAPKTGFEKEADDVRNVS